MKFPSVHKPYIWQHPDWPQFEWDPNSVSQKLEQVVHLHGVLKGRISMVGLSLRNDSNIEALCNELLGSSRIEGITLDPRSVRSSIARKLGVEEDGLLATDHYVEGLVDVMLDAIANCRLPLTADRLFGWHAALFPTGWSGPYKIAVASWRVGEQPMMQVVSGAFGREKVHYEAPPSLRVPEEMDKLIEWGNSSELSPLLKAAIAHLWFVTIHPFDDGNGRIARTLADMFLSPLDDDGGRFYSMSAEINSNNKKYYDILERTQKGNLDITEWILWFLDCLESALSKAMDSMDVSLSKGFFWAKFADVTVNERQRKVLNRMWDGFDGKLTTSKWAKICHCSQDTALRDINGLLEKGLLIKGEKSGRSSHYLLPSTQQIESL